MIAKSYPYLDSTLSSAKRVDDLLPRLTLEEKAGLMFHAMLQCGPLDAVSNWFPFSVKQLVLEKKMNHFNVMGHCTTVKEFVDMVNTLQKIGESTGWGIPITISTDPRHGFKENPLASSHSNFFSAWPEHIGLAALGDPEVMREYADTVRQEYTAVGIRAALHPQVDLLTEYRWSRSMGSLGEDNKMAGKLGAAHVTGLQGEGLSTTSVAACAKHFPGCGPTRNGYDPHFAFGSDLIYPGENFDYHLQPFKDAIAAGTRVIMPAYGKPIGTEFEEVAMSFNKGILTDLLRGRLGFTGVILTDFGLINDYPDPDGYLGDIAQRRSWGLEHLSAEELAIRALEAGVDQFGGETCPEIIVKIVRDGKVKESRLDESVRRLLLDKFDLGLFDNRYIDVEKAEKIVGNTAFRDAGFRAQMDSLTILKNENGTLPLKKGNKVYTEGFDKKKLDREDLFTLVDSTEEADIALILLETPFETLGTGEFAKLFHHGHLDFDKEVLDHVGELSKKLPVVLVIDADRPPVLGSLVDSASGILFIYGASEPAVINVLFGAHNPKGKLPFDLPRSMKAIEESRSDVAFDTKDPVYKFGHGLRYD